MRRDEIRSRRLGVADESPNGRDGFDVRSLAVTYSDGFHIAEHGHPWAQLVYATRGIMSLEADRAVWFVPPTRAIWVPPGCRHRIRMQGEVALRTLYLAPERARGLALEARTLEVSALLRELILHVLALGMLDPEIAEHDRLAGVLTDLIARAPVEDLALPLPTDPRARNAADWLEAHPAERRDLASVAREAGASLRTLQRLFAQQTGMPLDNWRQKARLIHAASRLSTGASVTETALACGYDSPSAFTSAFRRQFGVTPGRYGPRTGEWTGPGTSTRPRNESGPKRRPQCGAASEDRSAEERSRARGAPISSSENHVMKRPTSAPE